MKILVTGGAGFIGSNFIKYALTEEPELEITALDDLSTGLRSNLEGLKCKLILGSILDVGLVDQLCSTADAVVHLAAIGSVPRSVAAPRPTHDANVTGTLNVLEACRKVPDAYVVLASSSSVYGSNPELPKTELTWTRPMSPYAVSKLATEAYANAYFQSYGLKTLAFRFFNVYGPAQRPDHAYAAVIPKFVDAALNGSPLELYGDGTQSRDFTYVDTVAEVIWKSILDQVTSEHPVNLAFGSRTSLLELVQMLGGLLQKDLLTEFHDSRVGDVKASQADSSRLRELFPSVTPVPLETGIAKTVEWFQS